MILRPFIDREGRNPFELWFRSLESTDQARITVYLDRLERGNLSNTKSVGSGVVELRMNFGPGFRIYFGREGDMLVILLGGGSKKSQRKDIATAQRLWSEY
ncbi:MAG TPA: type II toxin-antitoxin system RelE/ParE family toxin, partial [Silvibacterium sp.]|nr:type II toxin-antitoxin system RelE/ParE family toxin [Silvibacterium sp.]